MKFLFIALMLAHLALPLSINFIGYLLCLVGAFQYSPAIGIIGACSWICSSVYCLRLYRLMFGQFESKINALHVATVVPIVVLVITFGISPNLLLRQIEYGVQSEIYHMYLKARGDAKAKIADINGIRDEQ